jgi:hypothetical protein
MEVGIIGIDAAGYNSNRVLIGLLTPIHAASNTVIPHSLSVGRFVFNDMFLLIDPPVVTPAVPHALALIDELSNKKRVFRESSG